jgi:hypothetical protein
MKPTIELRQFSCRFKQKEDLIDQTLQILVAQKLIEK